MINMDPEYPDDKIANNGKAPLLKHTVKDSVFTDLFGNAHYLIQMYRALHPESRYHQYHDQERIDQQPVQ